jgi:hypothetical protein
MEISSLMDTWLLLQDLATGCESRGEQGAELTMRLLRRFRSRAHRMFGCRFWVILLLE